MQMNQALHLPNRNTAEHPFFTVCLQVFCQATADRQFGPQWEICVIIFSKVTTTITSSVINAEVSNRSVTNLMLYQLSPPVGDIVMGWQMKN